MEKLIFPKIAAPSEVSCTEYMQSRADYWNSLPGNLKGCDCPECKNKGLIAFIEDGFEIKRPCKCVKVRDTLRRIHESGLEELLRTCTFQSFETAEPFQEHMKRSALDFIQKKSGCFFACGQSGCGKTHICTAIVGGMIKQGLSARYFVWREESSILKSHTVDAEYKELIEPYCENMLEAKAKAYSISEKYMNRFIKKNGSVVCRDLLGYDLTKPEDSAKIKELNLFRTTCPAMIKSAVEILEEIIGE